MDWTGGVRRRFALGKNNAMIQKQKAHFAKARAALPKTSNKNSSFKPEFHGDPASSRQRGSAQRFDSERSADRHHILRGPQWSRYTPSPRGEASTAVLYESQWQTDKKGEVIHITSSSVPRIFSSDPYENNKAVADDAEHTHRSDVYEGQKLLLANRRRFLARSDWLGLSATKPVRIRLRSSWDEDRIGKRRKVANSTSQRGRPATRRLITPLFEERLLRHEHMMSGALQSDEVHVKIGTDALANQTQCSCNLQTPRLATGRKSSTDLGPLSEEPMLLGDEGDDFEVMRLPFVDYGRHGLEETHDGAPGADEVALSQYNTTADSDQVVQRSSQPQHIPELAQMIRVRNGEEHTKPMIVCGEDPTSVAVGEERERVSAEAEVGQGFESAVPKTSSPERKRREEAWLLREQDRVFQRSHDEENDEAFWRRLMQFEDRMMTNPSVEAVRSSSQHATAATSSHRPFLRTVSPEVSHIPSTPKGVGTQRSDLHSTADLSTAEDSVNILSPSASLQRIQGLVEQPGHPPLQRDEENDDDAAWRDFIIGSHGSSETSFRPESHYGQQSLSAAPSAADADANMSLLDVSGLGTSVESTAGFTHRPEPQDEESHYRTEPRSTSRADRVVTQKLEMPQHKALTAAAGHSANADDIEESRFEPTRLPKLVQPSQSSILNPKRFKSTKRPHGSVSPSIVEVVWRRQKIPRRMARRAKDRVHSVYDLVDSDGASVA